MGIGHRVWQIEADFLERGLRGGGWEQPRRVNDRLDRVRRADALGRLPRHGEGHFRRRWSEKRYFSVEGEKRPLTFID